MKKKKRHPIAEKDKKILCPVAGCGSWHIVHNGSSNGLPRYKCTDCGTVFSLKSTVNKKSYRLLAGFLYENGLRPARIAKVMGVTRTSVVKWLALLKLKKPPVFRKPAKKGSVQDFKIKVGKTSISCP